MAGLIPAIHVFYVSRKKGADARHDELINLHLTGKYSEPHIATA
jgi:hypothetical protein